MGMQSSRYDGSPAPSSPVSLDGCVHTPGATFLLLQDVVPWAAAPNQDPLGADVTELKSRAIPFDMCTSDQIGKIDLDQYSEILIAAAQTQTFYNHLFPSGVIHPDIRRWVEAGGVLSANLADHASGPGAGGNWDGRVFVGGVTKVNSYVQDNAIVRAGNPVVSGLFGGPNGGTIVNVGPRHDLDDWNSSSHGYFTNLPLGTVIILGEGTEGAPNLTRPVFVQYPHGKGVVLASMTTTEWRYVGDFGTLPQNRKLLANEIGYQSILSTRSTVIWECGFPECSTGRLVDVEGDFVKVRGLSVTFAESYSLAGCEEPALAELESVIPIDRMCAIVTGIPDCRKAALPRCCIRVDPPANQAG